MLYHLGVAFAGIGVLMGGWVLVQALKRRSDPRFHPGDDVLAGCGACSMGDVCHAGPDRGPGACALPGAAGSYGKE
jgi:hypothetical protein